VLSDGTKVDVQTGRDGEPSFEKPPLVSATYANSRWRKYLMNIWEKDKKDYRLYYGKYLCRQWNAQHGGGKRLAHFEIFYMRTPTVLPPETAKSERVSVWQHDCFGKAKS
jgi:hypothetical protein